MKKGILITIRNSHCFKAFSLLFSIIFLLPNFIPAPSFALTSGPSAPEASGFTPVEQQQLVDPFTGDFSYNIPLLNVGDYPLNLSYSSAGVNMDAEASWVGLGWNLNVGAINRTVRGLPDDFSGDPVQREFNMKDNVTVGGTISVDIFKDVEIAGSEMMKKLAELLKATATIGGGISLKYNNYTGISIGQSITANLSVSHESKLNSESSLGLTGGAGLSLITGEDGLTVAPNATFSYRMKKEGVIGEGNHASFGLQFNSRSGLKARTLSLSPHFAGRTELFGALNFTPQFKFPFSSSASTFSFKLGGKIFPVEMSATATGSFAKQTLAAKQLSRPAYGYIYLENGQNNQYAQLDFNREKDASFMPGTPHLPPAYLTYDIFAVGAQGTGGTYRAYRNEAGYVFDSQVNNTSSSGSLGAEANLGNTFKGGIDLSIVDVSSHTSVWKKNNMAIANLQYGNPANNLFVRNVYFKKIGEISNTVTDAYYYGIGENSPVRNPINGSANDLELSLESKLAGNTGNTINIAQPLRKMNGPLLQKESMQILKVGDVNRAGLYQNKYFTPNAKSHHIGQIIINADDGKRYVFGLPAYNNVQKEVSFNVNSPSAKNDPSVGYSPGIDNSVNNTNGLSHFYESTSIPPFSYAYYLTDVLSTDYSDMTGDGPTPDDYGTYTRFHYTNHIPSFKWRTPFVSDSAQYDPGLQSIDDDDKGNYIYGTRDVWYIDSIETKNEVAVFHTSARDDAYEAASEDGGKGSNALLKLDSISFYNLHDRKLLGSGATPLRRVHFVYDYSLCPGIPNGITGKLTLIEIYTTYGESYQGRREKYEFGYSDENPSYNIQSTDNWGTYKPELSSGLSNRDFPYTIQDTSKTNLYASAWLLNHIQLPSGGYYDVLYESDNYNYVQDKPAMKLYTVLAAVDDISSPINLQTPHNILSDETSTNRYLVFSLDKNIYSKPDAENYVKSLIGNTGDPNGIANNLYFKFKVNLDKDKSKYDFVYGFCELDNADPSGAVPTNTGEYLGWVKVIAVKTDRELGLNCNPISKAAFNFCRLNTPRYAFDQVTPGNLETDPVGAIKDLWNNFSIITQLFEFIEGPNQALRTKGIGQRFVPGESSIRLLCREKLGGGARVKRVIAHNAWDTMQPGEDMLNFTDDYSYVNSDGVTSSGIATYEPFTGGEENPFRLPVTYTPGTGQPRLVRMLIPDEEYMLIKPYGEMAFPSPAVGYSRVVMQRRVPVNSSAPGTGYTEYSYYTARDYPVVSTHTRIQTERRKKKPFFSLFNKKIYDYVTASQGYSVIVNDMHGKLRSSSVYDAFGRLISQMQNEYVLDKGIDILGNQGIISNGKLGREIDFVADFREEETTVKSSSLHVNAGMFILPFPVPPIFLVLPIPVFEKEYTRFRSATETKVIYNYAILNKQTVTDLGSSITTKNLVYDPVTANPVLTAQNNAFGDEKYVFSYPARMIYPGMDAASINTGLRCSISTDGDGKINNPPQVMFPGDEIVSSSGIYGWAYRHTDNNYYLIDRDGKPLENLNGVSTILRSGRRNMLDAGAGTVVTLQNPIVPLSPTQRILEFSADSSALDANAVTYNDYWFKPEPYLIDKKEITGTKYPFPGYNRNPGCDCYEDTLLNQKWTETINELIINNQLISPTSSPYLTNTGIYWYGEQSGSNTIIGHFQEGGNWQGTGINLPQCFTITIDGTGTLQSIANLINTYGNNIGVSFIYDYENIFENCELNSFYMVLYAKNPICNDVFLCGSWVPQCQYGSLNFTVTSCLDLFPCEEPSDIRCKGHELEPTICDCQLTDMGLFWENIFSELIFRNNFLTSTPGDTSGTVIPVDSGLINILDGSDFGNIQITHPPGQPTIAGIQTGWNLIPQDSIAFGVFSYSDNTGNLITDTCFVFDIDSSSMAQLSSFIKKYSPNIHSEILWGSHSLDCNVDYLALSLWAPDPCGCGKHSFTIPFQYLCGDSLAKCEWKEPDKDEIEKEECECFVQTRVNPYHKGILGNWRKFEEYRVLVDRFPESTGIPPDLREHGFYNKFYPFWNYSSGWQPDTTRWTRIERITAYDFNGNAMESKDATGIFASRLYGYQSQLPVAEVVNSRVQEAAFDGFEDYYNGMPYSVFNNSSRCYNNYHFKFEDYANMVTSYESHSGWFSLLCQGEVSITKIISPPLCEIKSPQPTSFCSCEPSSVTYPYQLRSCEHQPVFSPPVSENEKKYLLSFWVLDKYHYTPSPFKLDILVENVPADTNSLHAIPIFPQGPNSQAGYEKIQTEKVQESGPIEGWKQYTYAFILPAGSSGKFRILFHDIYKIYLDDVRIHPADANMRAFVFNPFTHRLMATLDENNFAVFYQYDNKGTLQTIRRETERGIMTVSYNIIEQKLK